MCDGSSITLSVSLPMEKRKVTAKCVMEALPLREAFAVRREVGIMKKPCQNPSFILIPMLRPSKLSKIYLFELQVQIVLYSLALEQSISFNIFSLSLINVSVCKEV